MKKLNLISVLATIVVILSCNSNNTEKNTNKENKWQSLFNGENLDGWTAKINHHELGDNFANTFRVNEGKIQVNYDEYQKFNNQFGHLFYKEPFSSYHLKFEYHFTDQWREDAPSYAFRNSGVMFHSQDPKTILKDQEWPVSIEYQILAEAEEGVSRPTGNVCTPGTDIYQNGVLVQDHCKNSASKTYKPDEWVNGDLIVYSDSLIIHMVDGDTVLQYSKPTIGGGVVNEFDSTVIVNGKLLKKGFIALQSEGNGIEFRNIKIKKLD
jgi:hypothetical protein